LKINFLLSRLSIFLHREFNPSVGIPSFLVRFGPRKITTTAATRHPKFLTGATVFSLPVQCSSVTLGCWQSLLGCLLEHRKPPDFLLQPLVEEKELVSQPLSSAVDKRFENTPFTPILFPLESKVVIWVKLGEYWKRARSAFLSQMSSRCWKRVQNLLSVISKQRMYIPQLTAKASALILLVALLAATLFRWANSAARTTWFAGFTFSLTNVANSITASVVFSEATYMFSLIIAWINTHQLCSATLDAIWRHLEILGDPLL
jgi:hypothetical protein